MADLVRGWFDSDGGISHAVDPDNPGESLCRMTGPHTRKDSDDRWANAPIPRCQRCEQAALARR